MADERREPAKRYKVSVFIGAAADEPALGCTRDISASGLFLETQERPSVDSEQAITLVWGDDTYFCKARVVRHDNEGIGLTFIDPSPGFLYAITEITQAMTE